jgi:small multidrug resistance pump
MTKRYRVEVSMKANLETVESATSSTWLLLGVAVAFEIAGALGLRFSDGFTLVLPTVAALAAFAVALYLVSRVMKQLPVSIAYPVWAGGGTAGVALIGVLVLGEELNAAKALGLVLVVVGVVIVNMVSEKRSGC